MRRLLALAAVALAGALAAGTAPVQAHGLLQVEQLRTSNVALPIWAIGGRYAASPKLLRELHRLTDRPARSPIKVVIVAQKTDIAQTPRLFGRPQAYAGFLADLLEQQQVFAGPLVIVMSAGVGLQGVEVAGAGRLRPRGAGRWNVDPLLTTAIEVVNRIRHAT